MNGEHRPRSSVGEVLFLLAGQAQMEGRNAHGSAAFSAFRKA